MSEKLDTLNSKIKGRNDYVKRAVEAIWSCFDPLRHAETELEACHQPTVMKIIPMLEDLKVKLSTLSTSAAMGPDVEPINELTSILAEETLSSQK